MLVLREAVFAPSDDPAYDVLLSQWSEAAWQAAAKASAEV
jgi:hypothetical protein